jgi:hypothetical protein
MIRKGKGGMLGGIALESVDGANINGVVITNITIQGARSPIFLRVGNRGRAQEVPTPGSMENITISNVTAKYATLPCIIAGLPERRIKHICLDNIVIEYGSSKQEHLSKMDLNVLECSKDYPEPMMFGALPTWGFYIRHVEALMIKNIQLRQDRYDPRTGIVLDDVHNTDLDFKLFWAIEKLDLEKSKSATLWINNSTYITIGANQSINNSTIYKITGEKCKSIAFIQKSKFLKESTLQIEQGAQKTEIDF